MRRFNLLKEYMEEPCVTSFIYRMCVCVAFVSSAAAPSWPPSRPSTGPTPHRSSGAPFSCGAPSWPRTNRLLACRIHRFFSAARFALNSSPRQDTPELAARIAAVLPRRAWTDGASASRKGARSGGTNWPDRWMTSHLRSRIVRDVRLPRPSLGPRTKITKYEEAAKSKGKGAVSR